MQLPTVIVLGIAFTPSFVSAQESLGDSAMGAAAGAIVAGLIGAIAGGLAGYTAGPSIARSWGLHHHRYYDRRYASRERDR